ncbi:MAG: hypothetical protein IJV27_11155, partial [Prevotella sp.]|nr:hypothetical protein [Prevotella sp.]
YYIYYFMNVRRMLDERMEIRVEKGCRCGTESKGKTKKTVGSAFGSRLFVCKNAFKWLEEM